jgi:hypothetical protein
MAAALQKPRKEGAVALVGELPLSLCLAVWLGVYHIPPLSQLKLRLQVFELPIQSSHEVLRLNPWRQNLAVEGQ